MYVRCQSFRERLKEVEDEKAYVRRSIGQIKDSRSSPQLYHFLLRRQLFTYLLIFSHIS